MANNFVSFVKKLQFKKYAISFRVSLQIVSHYFNTCKKKIAHKPSQMSITSMYNILFLFYFVWCVCVPLGRHAMNFVTATYNKYGLTPAFHYWPNCSFVKYTNQ